MKSTPRDAVDMRRMSNYQQLVRHFKLPSFASFVALATAAGKIGVFVLSPGLVGDGRAGLISDALFKTVELRGIWTCRSQHGRALIEGSFCQSAV